MDRQRSAGKTGKPNAGKLARSVWSGGKVAKPDLSLQKTYTHATNKQKINQAHDAYGKDCLSRKEVAIDFLKGHLPKELVDMLDLDSLELTKGSFVDSLFQFGAVPDNKLKCYHGQ